LNTFVQNGLTKGLEFSSRSFLYGALPFVMDDQGTLLGLLMRMLAHLHQYLCYMLKRIDIVIEYDQVLRFLIDEFLEENLNFFYMGKGRTEVIHFAKLRIMDNLASD
jgi:hypothetical protein